MTTTAPDTGEVELVTLHLDQIVPHPHNVRTKLGDITELVKSIEADGIKLPVAVLPPGPDGKYMLIDGWRRFTASQRAKQTRLIPAIVHPGLSEAEVMEMMLVAGIHQSDISPVDEARGYARLIDLDTKIADIARKVGRSQAHVKSRIALLALPARLLDLVAVDQITLGQAAELIEHADDLEVMDHVAAHVADGGRLNNLDWMIRRFITDRDEKAAMADALAELEAKGITLFARPDRWYAPWELTLSKACPLKHLGITSAKHAKEPCHAIDLRPQLGKVDRTALCTNPKRHTTKAKPADRSELQMDPALYAKNESGPGAEYKAEKRAREHAHQSLMATATTALTKVPRLDDDLLDCISAALETAANHYNASGIGPTVQLLGLKGAEIKGRIDYTCPGGWEEFYADPANRLRAIAGLAVGQCSTASYDWTSPRYIAFLTFCMHNGHEATDDGELDLIEKAFEDYQEILADDAKDLAEHLAAQAAEDADAEQLVLAKPELNESVVNMVVDALMKADNIQLFNDEASIADDDNPADIIEAHRRARALLEKASARLDDGPDLDLVNAKLAALIALEPPAADDGDTLDAEVAADDAEAVPA